MPRFAGAGGDAVLIELFSDGGERQALAALGLAPEGLNQIHDGGFPVALAKRLAALTAPVFAAGTGTGRTEFQDNAGLVELTHSGENLPDQLRGGVAVTARR